MHRDWLRSLEAATGKKLTTLAKAIGISPSTLTRPVAEGANGTSTLHATTIQKLVEYTGVAAPGGADIAPVFGAVARPSFRVMTDEAVPFNTDATSAIASGVRAIIGGRPNVQAATFRARALEAIGYFPGDVLIYEMHTQPTGGDVVRAEIYGRGGEVEETVWRIFDPPFLVGAALDVAMMPKPIIVSPERVVVTGVVVGMVRPPKR